MVRDNGDQRDHEAAVEAVGTNEARLQMLIGSIDEVVFEFDATGIVLNVWTRDVSLLTRPPSEIVGRRAVEALNHEFAAAFETAFQRALTTGHSENLEYSLDVIAGRKWFLARINSIPAPSGAAPTVCMLVRDITERKLAEEKLKQTTERLSHLLTTLQTLSSTLNLDDLLEQLLDHVVVAVPAADFGTIYIYDAQAEVLIPKVGIGGDLEALWQVRLRVGESISGRVLQSGQSILTRTPEETDQLRGPESPGTERLFAQARLGRPIQSNICVPLRSSTGEVIGTVALGSIHDSFNEDDLSLLEGIASQAAIAIQNAKLFDEVRAGRERLRGLSSQLITTQETERCHLARELHDEIGQVLTTIKMHLRSTQRSVEPRAQSYLEESITMVDRAIGQVRNLSLNLRPAQLDELGLVAALHWYVKQQAKIAGFQENFVVAPAELQVPPELATACFRITQEALTNAVRHGQPRCIHIELRLCDDQLNLTIHDDGVGFDIQAARHRASLGKSLGLLGMQERAQLSDGHLKIDSKPGFGTTIRVQFPMPPGS